MGGCAHACVCVGKVGTLPAVSNEVQSLTGRASLQLPSLGRRGREERLPSPGLLCPCWVSGAKESHIRSPVEDRIKNQSSPPLPLSPLTNKKLPRRLLVSPLVFLSPPDLPVAPVALTPRSAGSEPRRTSQLAAATPVPGCRALPHPLACLGPSRRGSRPRECSA